MVGGRTFVPEEEILYDIIYPNLNAKLKNIQIIWQDFYILSTVEKKTIIIINNLRRKKKEWKHKKTKQ